MDNETIKEIEQTVEIVQENKQDGEQKQEYTIEKAIAEAQARLADTQTAESVIECRRQKDLANISQDQEFINLSHKTNQRRVNALLTKEQLEVLNEEQKNELSKYMLELEIQRLDYIKKHERKVIREETKYNVYQKKRANRENRYGYMYTQEIIPRLDEDGNEVKMVIYKDFTMSVFINRFKEFNNWYKNLSQATRNTIKITLKTVLWMSIIGGIIGILVGAVKWLINSGLLNIVM